MWHRLHGEKNLTTVIKYSSNMYQTLLLFYFKDLIFEGKEKAVSFISKRKERKKKLPRDIHKYEDSENTLTFTKKKGDPKKKRIFSQSS